MAKPSRIIDSHQHAFWHGTDDAAMAANLDEHGIDKAVVLTWDITPLERTGYEDSVNAAHAVPGKPHPGLPLADAVQAVRAFPDRFVLGYCPHPLDHHAVDRLTSAIDMYNVRVCGEWKASVHLDDPRCLELFRFCGERHLPVVFHIDVPYRRDEQTGETVYCQEWYGGTIANVAAAVEACPDTIMIGHGPGFWRYISGDADTTTGGVYPDGPVVPGGLLRPLLDEHPNLCADLSAESALNALRRDKAHGRKFLSDYSDRLLFGRDCYDGKLHEFLQSLRLSKKVAENIYHLNAERLMGIDA